MNNRTGKNDDDDLRQIFGMLRAEDTESAPGFSLPEISATRSPGWRLRPALPVAVGIAAILTLVLYFGPGFQNSDAPPEVNAIPFDELSELVSRELFTASAGSWDASTDFLLIANDQTYPETP